jgi:hypothetical protein
MALSLLRTGTSAGYGLVDILTEYVDQRQNLSRPFETITDYQRLAATVGGAFGAYMTNGVTANILETIELASLPLLEKSVANLVLSVMKNPMRFSSYSLKQIGSGFPRTQLTPLPVRQIPPRSGTAY